MLPRDFLAPIGRATIVLLVWLTSDLTPVFGQERKPSEYEVKAVYLYNFAKFVRWPQAARQGDTFTICVLGDDPFGEILDRVLAGETLDERRPVTKRIRHAGEADGCRIVFLSASEERRMQAVLDALADEGVLTVSDVGGFSRRGGVIELVVDQGRVRFEVNLAAAQKAGLEMSSELLKVARAVRRESSFNLRDWVRASPAKSACWYGWRRRCLWSTS